MELLHFICSNFFTLEILYNKILQCNKLNHYAKMNLKSREVQSIRNFRNKNYN